MNAAIIAGGLGTRLAGVWGGPKCLVPVAGKPVLWWIIKRLQEAMPDRIAFALGYEHEKVQRFIWDHQNELLPKQDQRIVSVELEPLGTAGALRSVLPALRPPILVLHGDTLQPMKLYALYEHWRKSAAGDTFAVFGQNSRYAGCMLVGEQGYEALFRSKDFNLDDFIYNSRLVTPVNCPWRLGQDFLDVGTPKDFVRAGEMDFVEATYLFLPER